MRVRHVRCKRADTGVCPYFPKTAPSRALSIGRASSARARSSGDATRTLVGIVNTNASTQFVDTATNRWVASYFNRRMRGCYGQYTVSGFSTSNATRASKEPLIENVVKRAPPE